MNRSELVENIAEATSQTKKDVDDVLNQMMESIKSAVASGDEVMYSATTLHEISKYKLL